jgi:TolB-like protein
MPQGSSINLSGDPAQEYFVDGMTDALAATLSQVGAPKVISRNSTTRFKGSHKPLAEIAAELGVDVVLEGSVPREGDRVAVNAQLTAADTDVSLWARHYERDVTSVLALQGELARAIAGEIAVELTPEQRARLRGQPEINLKTHEAYLRGTHEPSKRTPEPHREGIRRLLAAVDADPADPRAYADLASGYVRIGHGEGPCGAAFPRAKAAAERVLQLDPNLAEAHAALADVRLLEFAYKGRSQRLPWVGCTAPLGGTGFAQSKSVGRAGSRWWKKASAIWPGVVRSRSRSGTDPSA